MGSDRTTAMVTEDLLRPTERAAEIVENLGQK